LFASPAEYFGDASVGDLEDARDVAGSGPGVGQLDDLLARRVGQGAAVDVDPSELVDAAVTCTQICTKASSQRPMSLCSALSCIVC
jgi:hypothetical protein